MTISLAAEQRAWIEARGARGEFASVEDAVRQLLHEARLAEAVDDLAWARPAVDAALAAADRAETISLAEHRARNRARIAALPA